jgi:Kef-type K+ transport system membrane component KefB
MEVPPLDPGQVLGFVLLDVVIILIVARIVGNLFTRIGQPRVVGEIVAGILLGPSVLGATIFLWGSSPTWMNCDQAIAGAPASAAPPLPSITTCVFPPQSQGVLTILGSIALVFFMFLVGLELDYDLLKGKAKSIVSVSFGAVAVPIALAFAIGPFLFGQDALLGDAASSQTAFTLWVAGMLVVTAFPVMARILQEKGLVASDMGATGVAAAAAVTVLMFLTVAVADGVTKDVSTSDLVVKVVVALAYVAFMFLVVRHLLGPLQERYERAGKLTPGIFAFIIILLFASCFVAHQLGINVIVGGFLAGAVLPARASLFKEMAARLADITGTVLLPIFLAVSGLRTDFTKLSWSVLIPIVVFVVAAVVGKWAGSAVFARLGGLSWAEGNVIGILMNCRGLLVLVVALAALSAGVISPAMQVAGVVMALVTTMMTGPLFDWAAKRVPGTAEDPLPAAKAGYRVLVVVGEQGAGSDAARSAFQRAAEHDGAEVVLARIVALPDQELFSGTGSTIAEVERALRAMHVLAGFAPAGVAVTPVAYSSKDPEGEVRRLVSERGADLVIVPGAAERNRLDDLGVEVLAAEPAYA